MKLRSIRKPDSFHARRGQDREQEVSKSGEAWREQLTSEQFRILRQRGTERPFSDQSASRDSEGAYRCAACDAPLFRADARFDSGTGWPSFSDCEADGVELRRDYRSGIPSTEVICSRCGGHLGHVFGDGPGPKGKRYCVNDGALAPRAAG